MEKEEKREIRVFTFGSYPEFIKQIDEWGLIPIKKYHFYYTKHPFKIKSITELVKSKDDSYSHIINLYYNDDGIYLTTYFNNRIVIEQLIGLPSNTVVGIAHKINKYICKECGLTPLEMEGRQIKTSKLSNYDLL